MTVITSAFTTAARARAAVLGLGDHPIVVIEHPMASRTRAAMRAIAERLVDEIAAGLVGDR